MLGASSGAQSSTNMGRAATHMQNNTHPVLDVRLCGIKHQPVMQSSLPPDEVVKDVRQWRKGIAQYFQHLEQAGRFWQVQEEGKEDKLLLRSLVLEKQQQAMQTAGEGYRRRLSEHACNSSAGLSLYNLSPESFCRGNPRNALMCAIEVTCCTSKCAQELEEAYVAGADHADLAATVHSLTELFEARQHLLDLGYAIDTCVCMSCSVLSPSAAREICCWCCRSEPSIDLEDIQQQSSKGSATKHASWHSTTDGSNSRMHDATCREGDSAQQDYVGHCAVLHQIGYAWRCTTAFGSCDDRWPGSCQALPGVSPVLQPLAASPVDGFRIMCVLCAGMSWIPDDAWRMIADSVDVECEVARAPGPVGVAFQSGKGAKAWLAMLMQMQRLAWELHLMEISGVQLSQAVFALFETSPDTESGDLREHRFAALRALHALLLPTRSATLSAGIKSMCIHSPSATVTEPQ